MAEPTEAPVGLSPESESTLSETLRCAESAGHGVYLGRGSNGWVWARRQQAVLVVGPPRSGKTSSIVIPAVVAANGPVVSTSTKTEVMEVTRTARGAIGTCFLFDPTGSVTGLPGVARLHWSPVDSAHDWDRALSTAHALVATSRPAHRSAEASHWMERAESLLAPLFHAAANMGLSLRRVVEWVNRREATEALDFLETAGSDLPADLLYGISVTEPRELSGIWSTASEVLAPYRSDAALRSAERPAGAHLGDPGTRSEVGAGDAESGGVPLDPDRFVRSRDTLYICAPARQQALVAPVIVAMLEELRAATYALHDREAAAPRTVSSAVAERPPVFFALDEVANIAPIPDLPSLVSEGGGQGLTTLACIQDLSQARSRWGEAADGFFTLFGAKVVLPGVGDVRTVEDLSTLSGAVASAAKSVTAPRWWSAARQGSSVTWSAVDKAFVSPDSIARGEDGAALLFEGAARPERLVLTPYFASEPWRNLCGLDRSHRQREAAIDPPFPRARSSLADER